MFSDKTRSEASDAIRNVQRLVMRVVDELNSDSGTASGESSAKWPFTPPPPAADVIEEDEQVRVLVDLPGVHEKDLDLTLQGNSVVVEGDRRDPHPGTTPRKGEIHYGKFRREVNLPCEVLAEDIDATLRNGVLEIRLPRRQKKSGIKINLKS